MDNEKPFCPFCFVPIDRAIAERGIIFCTNTHRREFYRREGGDAKKKLFVYRTAFRLYSATEPNRLATAYAIESFYRHNEDWLKLFLNEKGTPGLGEKETEHNRRGPPYPSDLIPGDLNDIFEAMEKTFGSINKTDQHREHEVEENK